MFPYALNWAADGSICEVRLVLVLVILLRSVTRYVESVSALLQWDFLILKTDSHQEGICRTFELISVCCEEQLVCIGCTDYDY